MKIEDLAESYVVSFFLEQRHIYFEMKLIANGSARYEIQARNEDGSAIDVNFGQLQFVGNFTTCENIPSLGELESIHSIDGGVVLEGDFGDISIRANNITVKKLISFDT